MLAHGVDPGPELLLVDERLQVCVLEDVRELVLDVAVVDVDPHRAELEDCPQRLDPLRAVVRVDADVVAGADALGGEVVGETVGTRLHLPVRPPLAFGDEVLALAEGVDRRLEEVGEVEVHPA